MEKWNSKCRFFNSEYACDTLAGENYSSCEECRFASLYSKKILIIKLDGAGDVLRTTPILHAIKKKYGDGILIYWMASPESADLLKNNSLIDKVILYNLENVLRIQQEKFDILYSLEINTPATLLANLVVADEKFGFYFNDGATECFNKGAESYLETAFLNHIKLSNRRTYQDLIFESCELEYRGEKPIFNLSAKDIEFGKKFADENNLYESDFVVGINIGAGSKWKSKFWDNEKIKKFIQKLPAGSKTILLSGPNETEKKSLLLNELKKQGISVSANNSQNAFEEFASVINLCDVLVTGDTLAMHIATALGKPTIALFFSTPDWEVEGYDKMTKIQSSLLSKYFFARDYIPELVDSISVDFVLEKLSEIKKSFKQIDSN